jgi:predicted nucleotidyltransferase
MIKKTLIEQLIEKSNPEMDDKIVKSFQMKDELSSDIFEKSDDSYKMNKGVRDKLIDVSNAFLDFIDIDFFVHDIVLTGSLANYNWSEFSDVDLHILIDLDEVDGDKQSDSPKLHTIVKEFFDLKRQAWNGSHDIKIKGYEVEVYVQDVDEKHLSSGVYSILNNKWVVEPKKIESASDIDERKIKEKAEDFIDLIDQYEERHKNGEDITVEIDNLRKKLKKFRQSGLDDGGEYSYENLVFKLLRRNGYIGKMLELKNYSIDKKLSVEQ